MWNGKLGIRNEVDNKKKVETEVKVEELAVGILRQVPRNNRDKQDDRQKEEKFKFSIFCGNKDLDGSILQGVANDEWVQYNANTKVWYSSTGNILPVLQQEIKKEKPDHLFVTGIYDWQFNFKPLLFCRGVKKIISVRGMLHPGALSQKVLKKKIYLGLWKLMGLHNKVVFHATDETEKGYIQKVFGNSVRVKVAANFPGVLNRRPLVNKQPGKLKLVSIALISPMKNILLVLEALSSGQLIAGDSFDNEEILPFAENDTNRFAQQIAVGSDQDDSLRGEGAGSGDEEVVRDETPVGSGQLIVGNSFDNDEILRCADDNDNRFAQQNSSSSTSRNNRDRQDDSTKIEYNIYGPVKDKAYWDKCLQCIKELPTHVTVNYHGDINPDKIENALAQNHVFILPSKSENYGHSIIEALYAGRPVITSNHTPWNELEAVKAGMNVSITDQQELVNAIKTFAAMNQEELETSGKGARDYAEQAINIDSIRKQYEEMFG